MCLARVFESLAVGGRRNQRAGGYGVAEKKPACTAQSVVVEFVRRWRGRLEEFHTRHLQGGKQRNVALDSISETGSPVGLSAKPRRAYRPKAEESRWSDIHQTGMDGGHWSTTVSYSVMELPDTAYLPLFTTIRLPYLPPKTIPVMSGQERISGHV